MKLFFQHVGLILLASILSVPVMYSRDKNCDERVKFVQGGACKPGNGSKKHPFSTLADADADQANWDVLIVLSSTIPLDGGITLLDGRKLIGEENPTCITLSPTQPTITNTTGANGGAGVVVTGDATIENLYFRNVQSVAINYDNATNLCIKNVLITDFGFYGIQGACTRSGSTTISNVIIRNNMAVSGGILEVLIVDDVHRELTVCTCEISYLAGRGGIIVSQFGNNSTSSVDITNTYMHDFTATSLGIACFAQNNGQMTIRVSDSSFYNLGANGFHIVSSAMSSSANLCVNNCSFEELLENGSTIAVVLLDSNGLSEMSVKNCRMTHLNFSILTQLVETATQKIKITDNTFSSGDGGIFFSTESFGANLNHLVSDVLIKDNTFVGGVDSQAIVVFATVPWDMLTIQAENNCFSSLGGPNSVGLYGVMDAGNASIVAHHNSISGFEFDIYDDMANINYLVRKNWWGPSSACINQSGCGAYQTCENFTCLGPKNVVNLGTGIVDASKPLASSIQCPHACCPGEENAPSPQDMKLGKNENVNVAPQPKFIPEIQMPEFLRR